MSIPYSTLHLLKNGIRLIFEAYNATTEKEHLKTVLFGEFYAAHEMLESNAAAYARAMETLNNAKERAELRKKVKALPFWVEKEKAVYGAWCAFMHRNGDISSEHFNSPKFNSDNPIYQKANETFEEFRVEYEKASLKVVQLQQLKNDPRLKDRVISINSAMSGVDRVVDQFLEQMQSSITKEEVALEFLTRSVNFLQTIAR